MRICWPNTVQSWPNIVNHESILLNDDEMYYGVLYLYDVNNNKIAELIPNNG